MLSCAHRWYLANATDLVTAIGALGNGVEEQDPFHPSQGYTPCLHQHPRFCT